MRAENIRVGRVDHDPFDRLVQQRGGIVHQIGIQRVVSGDQHHQRALTTSPGSAGLLPERRHRSGEAGQHDRVEPGDVDAKLQRIGGGQAPQLAVEQRPLECVAVLGQIARTIGRHRLGQLRSDVLQSRTRCQRGQFGAAPRSDKRQGARPFGDQVGHHTGRLATGGPPYRGAIFTREVGAQGRLPQRHRPGALR